jgi:hypothetical protein
LEITGFRAHGAEQVASRGVSFETLSKTVKNPVAVLQQSGGQYLYISNQAAVVLNPAGQVITAYPESMFDVSIRNVLNAR